MRAGERIANGIAHHLQSKVDEKVALVKGAPGRIMSAIDRALEAVEGMGSGEPQLESGDE